MRYHERMIMLSVLDRQWKDHLLSMDHLREGIGLRGYGQQDPLVEYKRESFDMFEAMMQRFQEDTVRYLYLMQIIDRGDASAAAAGGGLRKARTIGGPVASSRWQLMATAIVRREVSPHPWMTWKKPFNAASAANLNKRAWPARAMGTGAAGRARPRKVGRNDPCPCGSGKKYKKCCGVNS